MNNRKSLFVDANETCDDDSGMLPAGEIIGLNESDKVAGEDGVFAFPYGDTKNAKEVAFVVVVNAAIRCGHTNAPIVKCIEYEIGRLAELGIAKIVIETVADTFGIKK